MQRSTRPTLVCVGAIDEARNALVAAVLEYVCHNCRAAAHGTERDGAATIAALRDEIAALRADAGRRRYADILRQVTDEHDASRGFDSEYAASAWTSREEERSRNLAAARASEDASAKLAEAASAELAEAELALVEGVRQWNEAGERADFVRDRYANVREEALRGHRFGDPVYEAARQAREDVDAAAMDLLRAKGLYV